MAKLKFDIQRFDTDAGVEVKRVALEVLNVFGQIVTNLGLDKISKELDEELAKELDNPKIVTEWLTKNANPVLNFIGSTKLGKSFANYAKLITNSISIIDNTVAIVKGNLPEVTRNAKIGYIASSLESMASATAKLSKDKDSAGVLSIVSGIISLTASLIAGMDGISESEQEKINRSYISFMRTLSTDIVKKVFAEAFDAADDAIDDLLKQGKFFTASAPVFLKTFNGIMTFGSGILNGYNKYKNNLEKYLDDGIPEDIAKHDAAIDGLAKFAKETMSGIVFGVDNVIFDVAKWITSGLGIEYAKDENKDYIETLIFNTKVKTLNYTNTGLSTDDKILYVLENGVMVYGDSGNDAIKNFGFSNATIWGGHDNDTIHSYKTESATPQKNSIFGGPGNDQITIYDKYSTIYGGKGNDTIFVTGTNNAIYSDAGNDEIAVFKNANQNTLSGGTGDDKIILFEGTKNALIQYAAGDGNDTIYYFDEDDALKISGSYNVSTSGSNVKISIGKGSILLLGAAGKNIKINGKTVKSGTSTTTDTIKPPNVPKMPETVKSPFIYGTNSNDEIENSESNVLIFTGSGNDTVSNGRAYGAAHLVMIDTGAGDDYINNHVGNNVSINGGSGDDKIYNNCGNSVKINGDDGNDFIANGSYSDSVSINAGAGDDKIDNDGDSVTIDGSDGNDYIRNEGNLVTIYGGVGNDKIYNVDGDSINIDTSEGNDSIGNLGGNSASINTGAGNDSIYNSGDSVTIDAGAGDDYIRNHYGDSVIIDGGDGNDLISLEPYFSYDKYYLNDNNITVEYKNGGGNDTVAGLNRSSTLKITGSKYSTVKSGNDIKIIVGNGSILIKDTSNITFKIDGTLSSGSTGNTVPVDTLPSGWKYGNTGKTNMTASVMSAANVDLTQSYGTNVSTVDGSKITTGRTFTGNAKANSIKGGTSADIIYGNAGADIIYGGSGNDKIYGGNDNDKLYGDAGSDSLYGNIGNDTLTGGAGNDTFFYETGYDVITDYVAGTDKIKLVSSSITSSSLSGSDVVLKTSNGNITVQNAKGKKITVIDKNGKETSQIYPSVTPEPTLPSGWKYGNTAKTNLTASVASAANVDLTQSYGTNVSTVDGSKITTGRTFTGNSKANSIKGGTSADIIYGNAGADVLYGGSGNDKIYGGNDNDKLYGDAGSDSLYGNIGNDTLTGGAGNDTFFYETGYDVITDYVAGTDKIKLVSSSITSSSLSGSDVVLKTSNGNITVQNAKGKKITVIDKNGKETSQIYPTTSTSTTPTLPSGWKYGNTAKTNMTASITSAANVDLTQGYGTNVATVDGAKITTGRTFTGNAKANSIKGGTNADIIYGNTGADILYGGSGNDKIYGGNDSDKLNGDAGNDSLYGNSGNDTLTGGAGNDTFFYETGNDVIADYVAGTDKIKLVSSSITSSSLSGSNVVLKTSNGNITVQNAKGKKITVIDKNGKETTQVYPTTSTSTTSTLPFGWKYGTYSSTNNTATIITADFFNAENLDLNQNYGKNVTQVNGYIIFTDGIQIRGNSLANSIVGGKYLDMIYGGAGNDTIYGNEGKDKIYGDTGNDELYGDDGNDSLYGGTGNDTLYGCSGSDVFVYENGNDTIIDYSTEDIIKISNTQIISTNYSGNDIVYTTKNGTLTVKNAHYIPIRIIDSSNKIYTQTYFKTLDLMYDNNFITDEFGIDEITEVNDNNYSVGKLENIADNAQICSIDSIALASYADEK